MRIKTAFAVLIAVAITALVAPTASAHTAMLRASPDRDATAGGSVSVVDLEFLDPVTQASVTVTYNGVPIPGRTTVPDGEVITFEFDQPLTEPGRYQVNYEMISFDSDFTTGGFFFTFDPLAEPSARIAADGSGGLSGTQLVLSGVGLAAVAAMLGLFVWRLDNRRREELVEANDGYDSWDDW